MFTGPGYWLDPRSGTLYPASSPAEWLSSPSNRQVIPLTAIDVELLDSLHPNEDADEICSLCQRRGLIWIRTDSERVTIHFWLQFSDEQRLPGILAAVARALPQIVDDRARTVALFNTSGGCEASAVLTVDEFLSKEATGKPIMQDREPDAGYVRNLRFDTALNRRVDELLGG